MGGLPCHKATIYAGQHKQKKCGQVSLPSVGFKPMNPVFEQAKKTFHVFDCVATVISLMKPYCGL
jgi:hypothetical protein